MTRDDEKVADGKENVSSRFKLSEFLKSTPEPLDNSVAAASGEEDENTSDDTEKHEFYSVPNTDDSQWLISSVTRGIDLQSRVTGNFFFFSRDLIDEKIMMKWS